ncbi:MAG: hypothetical protein ACKVWR_05170 [Acidimicrobiales bacterium]
MNSSLAFLLLALGLSAIGVAALWLFRSRPPTMEADMEQFNRQLRALAPPARRPDQPPPHLGRTPGFGRPDRRRGPGDEAPPPSD